VLLLQLFDFDYVNIVSALRIQTLNHTHIVNKRFFGVCNGAARMKMPENLNGFYRLIVTDSVRSSEHY